VKAVAVVTAARAIAKGEQVTDDDVSGYKEILLTEDDPNEGHITIVAPQGQLGGGIRLPTKRLALFAKAEIRLRL
jgi:hypothetical protein